MIAAVIENKGQWKIGQLRWGLIPFWAKDEKIGYSTINAKAETVSEKPAFKGAFTRRRCIIPADGFYEWRKLSAKEKQPLRIMMKSKEIFSMAGLYDTWTKPEG